MKCEFCNKEIDGSFGSGRFCDMKCSSRIGIEVIRKKFKGKKWEDIYGEEKTKELKLNRSEQVKIRMKNIKGKTYEEIYGKEKSKLIKEKLLKSCGNNWKIGIKLAREKSKGKTFEERYGKEKAKIMKIELSKSYEEKYGKSKSILIKEKLRKWSCEKIVDNLKQIGNIKRDEWRKYSKQGLLPNRTTVNKYFNSLDEIAEQAGIKFIKPSFHGCIGKNETKLLDEVEKEKDIKLERQFPIRGFSGKQYYTDGYDPINNTVYEVDEQHHKYSKIEDFIREQQIKKVLDCNFVRIQDF